MKMMKLTISVLMILQLFVGCTKNELSRPSEKSINYRQEMRSFVIELSAYAKSHKDDFIIIAQNGQELIREKAEGSIQRTYLQAIDATGREGLLYGYHTEDVKTPLKDKKQMLELCLLYEKYNVEVLVTDYCFRPNKVDDSYQVNEQMGFVSFAANKQELNTIPPYPLMPHNVNNDDIKHISQAKNFLYLINGENYEKKQDFINAVSASDYDLVIMDLYHNEIAYTESEIISLKTKSNGGERLVVAYMSIGEAEDYRYYWQKVWKTNKPNWLEAENPDWTGNYKVRYWDRHWQQIIFNEDDSYLKKIIDAGFDGVYLDIIDAFEYFEDQQTSPKAKTS